MYIHLTFSCHVFVSCHVTLVMSLVVSLCVTPVMSPVSLLKSLFHAHCCVISCVTLVMYSITSHVTPVISSVILLSQVMLFRVESSVCHCGRSPGTRDDKGEDLLTLR